MARTVYKSFLLWTRTLHIYATMLALVLLIFFSFTGFVMNHAALFDIDRNVTVTDTMLKDRMPAKYLGTAAHAADPDDMWAPPPGKASSAPAATAPAPDPEHEMLIETYLRMNGAHGERTSFDEQVDSVRVQFTNAGGTMEYVIAKPGGQVTLHQEVRNALALLSDLHKGTGTGGKWRLLIDSTAIFLMFASLSGLVLWISLPKRRTLGIVALVVSIVLCGGCFLWLRP